MFVDKYLTGDESGISKISSGILQNVWQKTRSISFKKGKKWFMPYLCSKPSIRRNPQTKNLSSIERLQKNARAQISDKQSLQDKISQSSRKSSLVERRKTFILPQNSTSSNGHIRSINSCSSYRWGYDKQSSLKFDGINYAGTYCSPQFARSRNKSINNALAKIERREYPKRNDDVLAVVKRH